MKLDALDHPKTLDFASRLNVTRPTAIGHLELFWHFVSKHSPQGNVGKFPDGSIARACEWQGDPESFLKALLKSGFLDESEQHRYLVHDWSEHCPNWVRAQLQKIKKPFFATEVRTDEPTEERSYERTGEPSTRGRVSKPSHTKGREGKGVHERASLDGDSSNAPEPDSGGGAQAQTAPASTTLARAHALPDDAELADAFAVIRSTYPKFTGRQDWPNAEHHWRMRLDEGAEVDDLQAGVARYAAFVAAGGVSGSAFVMTPGKFFGAGDHPWSQRWDVPTSVKPAKKSITERLAALGDPDDLREGLQA